MPVIPPLLAKRVDWTKQVLKFRILPSRPSFGKRQGADDFTAKSGKPRHLAKA